VSGKPLDGRRNLGTCSELPNLESGISFRYDSTFEEACERESAPSSEEDALVCCFRAKRIEGREGGKEARDKEDEEGTRQGDAPDAEAFPSQDSRTLGAAGGATSFSGEQCVSYVNPQKTKKKAQSG